MSLAQALEPLTEQQRIYVEQRLMGLGKIAAATAAGYSVPNKVTASIESSPAVQAALAAGKADTLKLVKFTRKHAHDMLMDAYRCSTTAAEQVQAVKELVKLHGIAEPQEVKHTHLHTHEMQGLGDAELMKLAGMEAFTLEGEFTEVVEDQPAWLELTNAPQ